MTPNLHWEQVKEERSVGNLFKNNIKWGLLSIITLILIFCGIVSCVYKDSNVLQSIVSPIKIVLIPNHYFDICFVSPHMKLISGCCTVEHYCRGKGLIFIVTDNFTFADLTTFVGNIQNMSIVSGFLEILKYAHFNNYHLHDPMVSHLRAWMYDPLLLQKQVLSPKPSSSFYPLSIWHSRVKLNNTRVALGWLVVSDTHGKYMISKNSGSISMVKPYYNSD